MNEVTLIHYASGQTDVRMESFRSVADAVAKARTLEDERLAYLSVPDEAAPNGIRLTRVERSSDVATTSDPTSSQVTDLHNSVADKEVKRFATRGHAIEKTTKVLSERIQQQKESEKVEAQVAQSETATPKIRGGGRPKVHADDMVVILKVAENPKKEGKENHRRFAAMMRVMRSGRCTVLEAIKAGVSRGDLTYDEAHGFIEVVKA